MKFYAWPAESFPRFISSCKLLFLDSVRLELMRGGGGQDSIISVFWEVTLPPEDTPTRWPLSHCNGSAARGPAVLLGTERLPRIGDSKHPNRDCPRRKARRFVPPGSQRLRLLPMAPESLPAPPEVASWQMVTQAVPVQGVLRPLPAFACQGQLLSTRILKNAA